MAPGTHAAYVAALVLVSRTASAGEPQATSRMWPATLAVQLMVGGEMAQPRGAPVAFAVSGELLWRARLGGFASLMSSSGSPILPSTEGGRTQPSIGDRISVPVGFAIRPFAWAAAGRPGYGARLLSGIGVQVGVTAENLRTSVEDTWRAGLHLGAGVEVPMWGGPVEGGLTLRVFGRFVAAPEIKIPEPIPGRPDPTELVFAPVAAGQIYGGLCYYP